MNHGLNKLLPLFLFVVVAVLFLASPALSAEEHVVTPQDLRKAVVGASADREANLNKLQTFLSSEAVQKAMKSSSLNLTKLEKAIPQLDDQELARLASQSERIRNDLAAGALTNEQLTYIVIALATAVVILVIVAS